MTDRVILSQYFANNDKRESILELDKQTGKYYVRTKSDFGAWFTSSFDSETTAELYAEDWVDGTKT